MSRTREDQELAAMRAEALFEKLGPDDFQDAAPMRRISAAVEVIRNAEAELERAVADARAEGLSWGAVGTAMGTSRQAAQQRFSGRAALARELREAQANYERFVNVEPLGSNEPPIHNAAEMALAEARVKAAEKALRDATDV